VKPFTWVIPNAAAARAVSFIRSAARCRTPSRSPSPQTSGGTIARWRSSIGSHTAWPTRWAPIAQHSRPVLLEQLALLAEVVGLSQCPVDLEVVAPAGELQPVESEGRGLAGQVLERQIGPLAREERDWSRHAAILRRVGQ
jgi:hypothetical protein